MFDPGVGHDGAYLEPLPLTGDRLPCIATACGGLLPKDEAFLPTSLVCEPLFAVAPTPVRQNLPVCDN